MSCIWALVPIKQLTEAKTRLAGAMDATHRRELVLAMAQDVLAALVESEALSRVVIVSGIADIDRMLAVPGASTFDPRPARGLNPELEYAADWAHGQGARQVLIVHADLPALTGKTIRNFLNPPAAAGLLRIAASKEGTGTNMLLSSLPLPAPLQFGKGSLSKFEAIATSNGIAIETRRDPLLAADIDELADLRELAREAANGKLRDTATARWLKTMATPKFLSRCKTHTGSIG